MILLKILGKFKKEYLKYVAILWPSSETISRKFTACKIQIIKPNVRDVIKKTTLISVKSFLKIFFSIEISQNCIYIFSTISLQFKYNLKYIFIKNVNKNKPKKEHKWKKY